MSSFAQLKSTLRSWPDAELPGESFKESPHERLRLALSKLKYNPSLFGVSDVASLVRNALRFEVAHGGYPKLTVPSTPAWPSKAQWLRFGCRASDVIPGFVEVDARTWGPSWLPKPPF